MRIGEASHPGPEAIDTRAEPAPDPVSAHRPPARDRSRSRTRSISPTIPWDDEFLVFQERKRQLLLRLAYLLSDLRLVEEEFQALVSAQDPMVRHDPRTLPPCTAPSEPVVAGEPRRIAAGTREAWIPLEAGRLPGQVDLNRLVLGEVVSFVYHQGERSGQRRCGAVVSLMLTPSGASFEMEERVEIGPNAGSVVRGRYWPTSSSGAIYSVQTVFRERAIGNTAAVWESIGAEPSNGVGGRFDAPPPTEFDEHLDSLGHQVERARRVVLALTDVACNTDRQLRSLNERCRDLIRRRATNRSPTAEIAHDHLRGVRIGEARHPGPADSDIDGAAQVISGSDAEAGLDLQASAGVSAACAEQSQTSSLSKGQKKKMKKQRANDDVAGIVGGGTPSAIPAAPGILARGLEPDPEVEFLWKGYNSSMQNSCIKGLFSPAEQARITGPVGKVQSQVDALWVNLTRLAGFVVRGRSDYNLQAAQQISQQIRGHMLNAEQELFNKIETAKLSITQLQGVALSDMISAEERALRSISDSAKARIANLREVEDRVQGSLLAMKQQEKNTLDAVDIACKVFDSKAETLDEIKVKQGCLATQLVRLQQAIGLSEDRLADLQDRLDSIPDQLRAHARSLHETLETRGSDEHSGGGFSSTSVVISSERTHHPVERESVVTATEDTRGRSLHRRVPPPVGSGVRVPSNRAHHASPVVLEFYTDMVTRDSKVAESAHVRGRSAGSRRASSLVHYALREVSSRSLSREAPVAEFSVATAKLHEVRGNRTCQVRNDPGEGSASEAVSLDPTDALIASLLDHKHIGEADGGEPSET